MIYPTRAAILATAAGAPVALVVAVVAPGRWYAGLAWPLAVLALALVDALSGARPSAASADISFPESANVGETIDAVVTGRVASAAPPRLHVALSADPLVEAADEGRIAVPLRGGQGSGRIALTAIRRGTARFDRLWLRWRGRLGLVWKQREVALDQRLAILPDIRPVRERGAQIFERHALQGLIAQNNRGDGTEFEALVEYRPGMDRRAIDWKQSARHTRLHAKEYRPERNGLLVLALDAGRQMCEPVEGLPRIDRAVSAALLAAWVALKLGDRVALYAFDSRPRLASGAVTGPPAFPAMQRLAAGINYSGEEPNYTLALTTLAGRLDRRAMIVLFTEFADITSAEFMVRASARLVDRHLLMVVVLVDAELEAIVAAAPEEPGDVTRAVTAAALLRERRLVLAQLRHLGAHIVEAEHDRVGERLVAAYLDIKRRALL